MYQPNVLGVSGLVTLPDARAFSAGYVQTQIANMAGYTHISAGAQLLDGFYLNIRQTTPANSITKDSDRFYPAVDVKWTLNEERAFLPQMAIGLQSAIGHRRTGAEYLVASKRFYDLDFTGGLGWGRLAEQGVIDNPLSKLNGHFDDNRYADVDDSHGIKNWFTGDQIGVFGGLHYRPSNGYLKGWGFQAEWSGDQYNQEQTDAFFPNNSRNRQPWALGITWQPEAHEHVNLGLGYVGGTHLGARLTLRTNIKNWDHANNAGASDHPTFRPFAAGRNRPERVITKAQQYGQVIDDVGFDLDLDSAKATIALEDYSHYGSVSTQYRDAAVHLSNEASKDIDYMNIHAYRMGYQAPSVRFSRQSMARAAKGQGSPAEIWHSSDIDAPNHYNARPVLPSLSDHFEFDYESKISLGEEDTGILHRQSVLVKNHQPIWRHLAGVSSVRVNVANNLDRITQTRQRTGDSVREDEWAYALPLIRLDQAMLQWSDSLTTNSFLRLDAGLLDEMYGGYGGAVLYRPFAKRYALGASAHYAVPRDIIPAFQPAFYQDGQVITGFVTASYLLQPDRIMEGQTTASLKLGRFLAKDYGGTMGLGHSFDNGSTLKASLTASFDNEPNQTLNTYYDEKRFRAYAGMIWSYPLMFTYNGHRLLPKNSNFTLNYTPIGRTNGQSLNLPDLVDDAALSSYNSLVQSWDDMNF